MAEIGYLPQSFSTLFFQPGAHPFIQAGWPLSFRDLPVSTPSPQALELKTQTSTPGFSGVAGHLNSGLHAYMTDVWYHLMTEQSVQPRLILPFNNMYTHIHTPLLLGN